MVRDSSQACCRRELACSLLSGGAPCHPLMKPRVVALQYLWRVTIYCRSLSAPDPFAFSPLVSQPILIIYLLLYYLF